MQKTYEELLEENIHEAVFSSVFDVNDVQRIQDEFAYAMNVSVAMLDKDCNEITKRSNFMILEEYDEIPNARKLLKEDICSFIEKLPHTEEEAPDVLYCQRTGMMFGRVRLLFNNNMIGQSFFGCVRCKEIVPDELECAALAQKLNISIDAFHAILNKVPVMSKERFSHIAKLVYYYGKSLIDLGMQNCIRDTEVKYQKMVEEELQHEKEEIEHQNSIDTLTQVYNRNYFELKIKELEASGLTPVTVVMGDVNNLKLTNDLFGHRHGDWLLQSIARVLKEEAFDNYIIGRYGGDEFNVLIPGGKRQDGEWYCHRVRNALAKCYSCCVMPSISMGVGKKSVKEERLKHIMEVADVKMYREKIKIKEEFNIINSIRTVLYGREILTEETVERCEKLVVAFAEYIHCDQAQKKTLSRLARMQDFGYVIVTKGLFSIRFRDDLTLEQKRELRKHPIIGDKIISISNQYPDLVGLIASTHEDFNGKGYPDGKAGEDIPYLARVNRVADDYRAFTEKEPWGMNLTKEEACQKIQEGIGTAYDPVLAEKFLEFIKDKDL